MLPARRSFLLRIASNTLFFLVLFPYLSLVRSDYDTQPWALIAAIMLVVMSFRSNSFFAFPKPLWHLLIIALYATLIYIVNSHAYYGLRSLAGYFSIFVLAGISYKTYRDVWVKLYLFAVAIWLAVGVVQFVFDPKFAGLVVARMDTGTGRGVTSLAVEPSYYAVVCAFLLQLNEFFHQERKYGNGLHLIVMLALIFQIVISYSVTGLLLMLIFTAVRLLPLIAARSKGRRALLASTLVAVAFVTIVTLFLKVDFFRYHTRAGEILTRALSDPISVLYRDLSVSERTLHVVLPWYALISGGVFGMGLGNWDTDQMHTLLAMMPDWVQALSRLIPNSALVGRIMSGWGSAVYELGIAGILLILVVLRILARSVLSNPRMRLAALTSAVMLIALLVMPVPLAFPLFGYVLGIHLHYGYMRTLGNR